MRFQQLYSPVTNNHSGNRGLSGSGRVRLGFNSYPVGKVCIWAVCSNNSLASEFNTRYSSEIKSKLHSARQQDQGGIWLGDGHFKSWCEEMSSVSSSFPNTDGQHWISQKSITTPVSSPVLLAISLMIASFIKGSTVAKQNKEL